MDSIVLEVEKREGAGKGPARRTRAEGKLPGVFYGPSAEPLSVSMDTVFFDRNIRGLGGAHLIELKSGDQHLNGRKVLVRDLQAHPVTGAAVHVDLLEVPLDKPIVVSIPLSFVGKAEGVTLGGLLQPILREVEISCLPTDIPQAIEVDVTSLGIHDAVHLEDLTLPAGATAVQTDNPAVVSVQPPTVSDQPEEGETAEGEEGATPAADGAATPEGSPEGGDKS